MIRKNNKKLKLLKGEKMMYGVIALLLILIPVLNVYTSAMVTETNIEVESLKANIENQTEENQSLSMQLDELASLENIQSIANDYGLSYKDSNILNID